MENEKLVLVSTFGTRAEADLAKGALEDAGFPAMVQADTAGKMRANTWRGRDQGSECWCGKATSTPATEFLAELTGQMLNFLKRICHEPRGGDLPKLPAERIMQQATGKSRNRTSAPLYLASESTWVAAVESLLKGGILKLVFSNLL